MKTLLSCCFWGLLALSAACASPQSDATKADPPCVTIREKVTAFKHRIINHCDGDVMVTLRWRSRLRTETSSYRLMGSTPTERDIEIINPGTVEVIKTDPIDSRCSADYCPSANPGRIRVTPNTRGGQYVLELDNSHSSYAFVKVEIVQHPRTPREIHSTVHGIWDIGDSTLFASLDPFEFNVQVAEAELN